MTVLIWDCGALFIIDSVTVFTYMGKWNKYFDGTVGQYLSRKMGQYFLEAMGKHLHIYKGQWDIIHIVGQYLYGSDDNI